MKGVAGWVLQRLTGLLLMAGLIVHFTVMHFSGERQISHEFVLSRISSPYWKAFDLAFLFSVIYHGFNGLWGILLEYVGASRWLKFSQIILLVSAGLLALTGLYIVTLR
ncbi:MAG: succinate dehydrogenase, hydrophobic membrane anchor protein [Acidobacteriota bacterium]